MKQKFQYQTLATVSSQALDERLQPEQFGKLLFQFDHGIRENALHIEQLHQIGPGYPADENLYILAHDLKEDFPQHSHNYFEINYVYQGEIMNVIDGHEFYMKAGDLAILNPNALQKLKYLGENALLFNFCLKKEFFCRTLHPFYQDQNPLSDFLRMESSDGGNYMIYSSSNHAYVQSLLNRIIGEYVEEEYRVSYVAEAFFLLLFSHLVETVEFSYYGLDQKALEIMRYIQKHCLEQPLKEMAGKLGYHPDYLSAYIKKHTGKNCKNIIQDAKLAEAVRLLEETDDDIYTVSETCGYSSPSHFFRLFRERYGMTPGEYRKRQL